MKRAGALAVGILLLAQPVGAAEQTNRVEIRNNVYAPADVHVARGEKVQWTLAEGRHSVTSDSPKGFDSGVIESVGKTFTISAPRTDVTLYYHCRIHGTAGDGDHWGSGMVGRIVVGEGSPPPPPPPGEEVRAVPSRRWPTLVKALDGLAPDGRYRIELASGTYRSTDVTQASLGFRDRPGPGFDVTIHGAGSRPTDVVFDGGQTGFAMSVDGLHLENVSFNKQKFAALYLRGADRWSVDDVMISRPGRYGIWLDGATHGRVRRTSISSARIAGISVRGCEDCDLLVDTVTVEDSLQGLEALGAGALVVRGSTFVENGVGVALKASLSDASPQRGAQLLLNSFFDNTNRRIKAPAVGPDKDLPVGAGVWIDGGSFDVVEHNEFDGHSFGVVLTGPSYSSRVVNNVLSDSVEADVAWDGVGANVCFAHNLAPDGSRATAMPPVAQDIYGCGLPATVGMPFPLVTATVLAWGLGVSGP
jgi:plastocyanin/nitrous oxidase accessory protein NosD